MAKNSRLDGLRAQAKKLERAAGNKISRMRKSKGVEVAGTKYDTRVGAEKLNRYTTKQLETHIKRMQGFNSRKTQFVPMVHGKPLPIQKWREAKREEKRENDAALKLFNNFANTFVPHRQRTIAELAAITFPKKRMLRSGQNRFAPIDRKSRGIVSEKKLDQLIKEMRRKHGPDYDKHRARDIRHNISRLVDWSPKHAEMMRRVNKLPDAQLLALWDLPTGFADTLVQSYGDYDLLSDADSAIEFSGFEGNLDEAFEILDWAEETKAFRG